MSLKISGNEIVHEYDPKTGVSISRQYGIRGKEAIRVQGNILYYSNDMKTWRLIEMEDIFRMVKEHIANVEAHEKPV